MSDEIDLANDVAEQLRAGAERHVRAQAIAIHGVGLCLNCDAELEGDARWCGTECRDDWEAHGKK